MAAAFRRRPPSSYRPVVLLVVVLVSVILVVEGISVAAGIAASSLRRSLVLSLRQWLLRVASVALSACRVASVALSCCFALRSSRHASWLVRFARLCRPIWLHRPLNLS